jgi:lipid-A-disaccharide synthase
MPQQQKNYRIFISAAEPSADAHCAGLLTALVSAECRAVAGLTKSGYHIEFVGLGGAKMAKAGCHLLENTVGSASMAYNVLSHLTGYYKLIKRITRYLKDNNVDLVIVCDSPSFNIHIAKAAKKLRIKTLFYVAPQLWAWGAWRIHNLRKYCDKLCCILPFEEDWFAGRGIDTVFVGNPLFDKLQIYSTHSDKYFNFNPENANFALMPGSRTAEIQSLWQPLQQIALRLKARFPNATFTTVAVNADRLQLLQATQITGFNCQYTIDSVAHCAAAADFSIVTSGSATLEVAAAGCPMVVLYQSSRLLWHLIGRWLIKPKYLSLVNILAGKELVPEFMPYFSSIEPIINSIELLIEDRNKLACVSKALTKLVEPLAAKKAGIEVAEIVIGMLQSRT